MTPQFGFSSTDANIPISLGIPAITIDSGGSGRREHALDEWIDVEKTASLKGSGRRRCCSLARGGLSARGKWSVGAGFGVRGSTLDSTIPEAAERDCH